MIDHAFDMRSCHCCGEFDTYSVQYDAIGPEHRRCERHIKRNPCAIDGCYRTTAVPKSGRLSNDDWLCSVHWKSLVPPRSAERRVYLRFFRLAKRRGWDDLLRARFWRVWRRIVAQARLRAAGSIDESEIAKLFGWD